jgi:undecaprenyl-diphosphatase
LGLIEALFLGIIQGLTEFLPISSSGHLVLFQNLLGITAPELLFDICLHVGTLGAVVAVFQQDIRRIVLTLIRLPALAGSAGGFKPLVATDESIRMIALIAVGSLPTAVLGLLFRQMVDQLFSSIGLVGLMLLTTGCLLWFTRRLKPSGRRISDVTFKDALLIGLVQGLAILPGISRSGSTISVALFLGVDRDLAGRFSFLLSIPAILGALILGLDASMTHSAVSPAAVALGTLSAGLVGYMALRLLLRLVKMGRLYRFAPYCWLVGMAAVVYHLI